MGRGAKGRALPARDALYTAAAHIARDGWQPLRAAADSVAESIVEVEKDGANRHSGRPAQCAPARGVPRSDEPCNDGGQPESPITQQRGTMAASLCYGPIAPGDSLAESRNRACITSRALRMELVQVRLSLTAPAPTSTAMG